MSDGPTRAPGDPPPPQRPTATVAGDDIRSPAVQPEAPTRADPVVVIGFAIGVGLVFVATMGVYWNFWRPAATVWTWGLGSFAVGAVIGALYALWRRVRL